MRSGDFLDGREKSILLGAAVFFLAVKITLVAVPTIASSMPRLGDDSYDYLWKAVFGGLDYSQDVPALADIAAETGIADAKGSAKGAIWKLRVHGKTLDTHSYFYDWLNRRILDTGLTLKWAFAVSEIVMAALLAAGLALFLGTVFGPLAAALALGFLSLALFATHGLHFLVAGTGTLGLALMLYHHLMEKGQSFNYAIILPLAILMLGFHPIAKVYLVVAAAVHAVSLPGLRDAFNRRSLVLAGILVGLPLCLALLPALFPATARFLTISAGGDTGHLTSLAEMMVNLRKSWSYISNFPINTQLMLAAGIAGVGVALKLGRARPAVLLAGLGLALAVVSQFHFFPGFPASVFARLSVFLYILLFGFAAWLFALGFSSGKRVWALGLGLIAVLLLADGARGTYRFAFKNLNERREVVDETRLSDQIRRLPDRSVVVYLETGIALVASLIAGGHRHGAIVLQTYTDAPQRLFDTVRRRKPKVAVMPNFKDLNVLSSISSRDLTRRRHGFPLSRAESLLVSVRPGQTLGGLHLYIRNPGAAFTLTAVPTPEKGRKSGTRLRAEVAAGFTGWIPFKGDFGGLRGVTVALAAGPAWIEGVSLEPPRAHLFWPWRRGALVGVRLRGQETDRYTSFIFSIDRLLGRRLGFIRGLIRHRDPVLSDASGLVFMRTVFDPN